MRKYFFVLVFGMGIIWSAQAWAKELKLEGINYDSQNPQESMALLNGELLKAGQTIGGFEVVSVQPLEVQIKDSKTGQIRILNMNKEFEKNPPKSKISKQKNKDPLAVFNLFQKKVLEGGASPHAEQIKRANFFSSLVTAAQGIVPTSGPAGEYQKFMDAFFRGSFEEAKTFIQPGSAAASVLETKTAEFTRCTAEYGRRFSHAAYKVESENKKSDKEVELEITQTVRGDVPGVTSAYGAAAVLYKHHASMVETDKGWKIKNFQYKPEATGGAGTEWLCVD